MIPATGTGLDRAPQKMAVARAGAKRAPRLRLDSELRARELMLITAHDLRTPLAAIKMSANLLGRRWHAGDEPSGADWAAAVFRISRVADEAFGLIDDLLSVARLQRPDPNAFAGPAIDAEGVVEEAIALQREALVRARCKVTLLRAKSLQSAWGPWDRGYLLRVFSNLLRNVARHAPGAPVRISLGRRGDRLRIVFADRGPGFPGRAAETGGGAADAGRTTMESHGLGLWIVRRAVEGLNGRLRIRSAAGRGVAYDIELPGLQARQAEH